MTNLTNLLKNKVKYVWNGSFQKAFEAVKMIMINNLVLKAPDFNNSFSIYFDASDVGKVRLAVTI